MRRLSNAYLVIPLVITQLLCPTAQAMNASSTSSGPTKQTAAVVQSKIPTTIVVAPPASDKDAKAANVKQSWLASTHRVFQNELIGTFKAHNDPVTAIRWLGPNHLVTAATTTTDDNEVTIWQIADNKVTCRLCLAHVHGLAGTTDKLYTIETGAKTYNLVTLTATDKGVLTKKSVIRSKSGFRNGLSILPNRQLITNYTALDDRSYRCAHLTLWHVIKSKKDIVVDAIATHTLKSNVNFLGTVLALNNTYIAVPNESTINIAGISMNTITSVKDIGTCPHRDETITCVAALPPQYLITGTNQGFLYLWDWLNGACLATTQSNDKSAITCLTVLADERVAYATASNTIAIWDPTVVYWDPIIVSETPKSVTFGDLSQNPQDASSSFNYPVTSLVATHNGLLFAGFQDGSIRIFA